MKLLYSMSDIVCLLASLLHFLCIQDVGSFVTLTLSLGMWYFIVLPGSKVFLLFPISIVISRAV